MRRPILCRDLATLVKEGACALRWNEASELMDERLIDTAPEAKGDTYRYTANEYDHLEGYGIRPASVLHV